MFHQATYATQKVFDIVGYFDEKYNLLADWIWESHSIDAGIKILFSNEELACFNYDGISRQGVYERDKEWVQWAEETFPDIKKEDLSFFIYCLDRNRHPLFDLEMINRVAFQYFSVEGFAETYYETVLLVCIEQCAEISSMCPIDGSNYIKNEITKIALKDDIVDLQSLQNWMINNIMQAYEKGVVVQNAEIQLRKLVMVRRTLNRIFYKVFLGRKYNKNDSRMDRVIRFMCYTTSKIISKNEFCSRRLYVIMRAVWYYLFGAKFVENQI